MRFKFNFKFEESYCFTAKRPLSKFEHVVTQNNPFLFKLASRLKVKRELQFVPFWFFLKLGLAFFEPFFIYIVTHNCRLLFLAFVPRRAVSK